MIDLPFDEEDIENAHELSAKIGALPGSHTGGIGQPAGLLAEAVLCEFLGGTSTVDSNREFRSNFDFVAFDKRIEVKTKRRTCPPQPNYAGSIPTEQMDRQAADFYAFVSIQFEQKENSSPKIYRIPKKITWCAICNPRFFMTNAERFKPGDESGTAGYRQSRDGYSLNYARMGQPQDWLDHMRLARENK